MHFVNKEMTCYVIYLFIIIFLIMTKIYYIFLADQKKISIKTASLM